MAAKASKLLSSLLLFAVGVAVGAIATSKSNDGAEGSLALDASCSLNESLPPPAAAYLKFKEVKSNFVPAGIPEVYGQELGLSFDRAQEAIDIVAPLGPTYGLPGKKITLTDSELERYKMIGFSIACQYCCGVKTLVKEDGSAACGCAHSQMMRGLIAYLLRNHPQMSNQQILKELQKWKITYFPRQTLMTELQKLKASGEAGIEEILEEFPDFLPEMVGGC
jgi:hypothetical protein